MEAGWDGQKVVEGWRGRVEGQRGAFRRCDGVGVGCGRNWWVALGWIGCGKSGVEGGH